MAGSRTVTLNVIGNSTGAQQALKAVGDHSEAQSKRMGHAFEGVLGTLNSSGVLGPFGEAIEKIGGAFDKMGEHGKAAGAKLIGIGAAGVGIGGIFTAIGDKDKAASQQLKASVEAIGGSYDDAKEKFEGVIKSNEKYGDSAKQTQDALSILTTGLGSADKATASMGDVLDLAAKRHEDLTSAATDWVKINEGKGTKILATLGLAHSDNAKAIKAEETATTNAESADKSLSTAKQKLADLLDIQHGKAKLTESDHIALRNAQQAVTDATGKASDAHTKLSEAQASAAAGASSLTDTQRVHNVVQGQAAAAADTFTGHMKALRTEIEDQAAKLGAKYGPALTGISAGITVLGGGVEGVSAILGKFKGAQEAATVATEALTVATEEQDVAEGIALGPIVLIIAAVVAVGVALYELWTHWSTVWGWIKDAVGAAVGFIKDHWDLILDILLGPVGFAVGEIIKHFDTIKGLVTGAIDFVRDHWQIIVEVLTGPIGIAVGLITSHWTTIKNTFTAVKDWIGDRIGDIVGFFRGLPGRLTGAAGDVFRFIRDAAADAKNWVSDRVDDIITFLRSIPQKIAGLGAAIFHEIVSNIPGSGIVAGVADKIGGLLRFAAGGRPPVGVPSLVGENGAEVFVPDTAGTIIPHGRLGGAGTTVTQHIYASPGMDIPALAAEVRRQLLQAGRSNVNVGLN